MGKKKYKGKEGGGKKTKEKWGLLNFEFCETDLQ